MKNKTKFLVVGLVALLIIAVFAIKQLNSGNDAAGELMRTEIDLSELLSSKLPVIINFTADGCPSCAVMEPEFEQVYSETKESKSAVLAAVDVWKYPQAANDFPVSVIPTQAFYNSDGTPFVPSSALSAKIRFDFYASGAAEHAYTVHVGILDAEGLREILAELK